MSVILTQTFKKTYRDYGKSMGFKQKGSLFIRTIGQEIIQTFCLFKGNRQNEFTVNIGIFPFCIRNDKKLFKEGNFRLEDFIKERFDWWEYNPFDYNSIQVALSDSLNHFMVKVSPVFENVVDYESYVNFINNYEIENYDEVLLNNYDKLYVYLKMFDFEKVSKIIDKMEEQTLEAVQANKILYTKEEDYEEYVREAKDSLKPLYQLKDAVEENNIIFFNELLGRNEKETKRILKEYGL